METLKTRLAQLKQRLLQPRPIVDRAPNPCLNCGYDQAVFLRTQTRPDFDLQLLSDRQLQAAFRDRRDGICLRCGIYQAYERFTPEQLQVINQLGKDITTSETAFHSYPIDPGFIAQFEQLYFAKRLQRWQVYFDQQPLQPQRCLFLRVWFGAAAAFIQQRYGAEVAGLDMSPACLQTTCDRLPKFIPLNGAINGVLAGEFLTTEPYDGVFVFHVLTHACDLHQMLRQLRQRLRSGGFVLFTREIERKPHNPFHMLHLSEIQLCQLLRQYFDRVDRIDDCGSEAFVPHITPYTLKGDEPDLIAWVDS